MTRQLEQLDEDALPDDVLLQGDVEKELTALRRLVYRLADADPDEVDSIFEAADQAVERVENLEDRLDEAERKAETSLGVARQVDDGARGDGAGPSKIERAKHLSRDEVIRRTAEGMNSGARSYSGKRSNHVGSVRNGEIRQMARPDYDLAWQTVDDAWTSLATTWDCFEIDDSGETKKLTLTVLEDVPEELVRTVEESLGRDDLAKRLVGGVEV